MSEYIYDTDGHEGHWLTGEEIIRCKDCRYWATEMRFTGMCIGKRFDPDGFCAWGERCFTTCKCGELIELGVQESVICPSCGRMVRE